MLGLDSSMFLSPLVQLLFLRSGIKPIIFAFDSPVMFPMLFILKKLERPSDDLFFLPMFCQHNKNKIYIIKSTVHFVYLYLPTPSVYLFSFIKTDCSVNTSQNYYDELFGANSIS